MMKMGFGPFLHLCINATLTKFFFKGSFSLRSSPPFGRHTLHSTQNALRRDKGVYTVDLYGLTALLTCIL